RGEVDQAFLVVVAVVMAIIDVARGVDDHSRQRVLRPWQRELGGGQRDPGSVLDHRVFRLQCRAEADAFRRGVVLLDLVTEGERVGAAAGNVGDVAVLTGHTDGGPGEERRRAVIVVVRLRTGIRVTRARDTDL